MSFYVKPGEGNPIVIEGLPFYEKEKLYRRLMLNPPEKLAGDVESLTWNTAGVKFRFRALTSEISVKAELTGVPSHYHMAAVTESGFDCYIGVGGAEPEHSGTTILGAPRATSYDCTVYRGPRQLVDVEINCPLYNGLKSVELGFDDGTEIYAPRPRTGGRILLYGSSIEQGGCSSRPGMCHANVLSRWLDSEVVCLGFSGAGRYERSSALAVREIPGVTLFLMNGVGNCWSPEHVRENVPSFISLVREKYPGTPILLFGMSKRTGERFGPVAEGSYELMSREVEKIANELAQTDPHLYHTRLSHAFDVDGHSMEYEETVDGCHPTDLGFYLTSRHLYGEIKKIRLAEAEKGRGSAK
ncbi:MAG: hypothetical protein J5830_03925 [Clostridia bacterium]|nr:hypothetical protein [Clostridia bacterium]